MDTNVHETATSTINTTKKEMYVLYYKYLPFTTNPFPEMLQKKGGVLSFFCQNCSHKNDKMNKQTTFIENLITS